MEFDEDKEVVADIAKMFENSSDPSKYILVEKIGSGQYGEVHKVRRRNQPWGGFLAKKTFKTEFTCGDGYPVESLREIQLLKTFTHPNIIGLMDIVKDTTDTEENNCPKYSIVLEFCEHDLEGLLVAEIDLSLGLKKNIVMQMMNALMYLHYYHVMHRDLKPANILLSNRGVLKLADFGLAKRLDGTSNNINVVTLYFRAPEIIFGDITYGTKVDVWAAGCIIAQLWFRQPLFTGKTESDLLEDIAKVCGPIDMMGAPMAPYYWLFMLDSSMVESRQLRLKLIKKIEDKEAIDLIDKLLVIDPTKRMDVCQALTHPFFHTNPFATTEDLAKKLTSLPKYMLHRAVLRRRSETATSST